MLHWCGVDDFVIKQVLLSVLGNFQCLVHDCCSLYAHKGRVKYSIFPSVELELQSSREAPISAKSYCWIL